MANGMMYNGAFIISAYPATGKSYVTKNFNHDPYRLSDADINLFKYGWKCNQNIKKLENIYPGITTNYLDYIRKESLYRDFIFISSHKDLQELMIKQNIPFITVYPVRSMKDIIIQRMIDRGDNKEFIEYQEDHFYQLINDIECNLYDRLDDIPVALYQLDRDQPFIDNDMLEYLYNTYY